MLLLCEGLSLSSFPSWSANITVKCIEDFLSVAVLHRLKNSEAVYPACRKRRLLGTYRLQSDC